MYSGTPRNNSGQSRSVPDQWGSNTTQIQGHESYDNGGPQFSKNNRFVNFTSTETRPAAALGSLLFGPFQLFTINKFLNLSFENANEAFLKYTNVDAQYGWATLDIDGSVTGVMYYIITVTNLIIAERRRLDCIQ